MLSSAVSIGEPFGPRARVGTTGIEHHCARLTICHDLLRPQDGGGFETIGSEDCGHDITRTVIDHESEIRIAGLLNARAHARGTEALSTRDGHGVTPSAVRPEISCRPSMRLAFCTACPAAPLTRLSSTLTTVTRPV